MPELDRGAREAAINFVHEVGLAEFCSSTGFVLLTYEKEEIYNYNLS